MKLDCVLMGMFHWSQLVSNEVFLDSREQCLQSQLGSLVLSQLAVVDWPNIKHV